MEDYRSFIYTGLILEEAKSDNRPERKIFDSNLKKKNLLDFFRAIVGQISFGKNNLPVSHTD